MSEQDQERWDKKWREGDRRRAPSRLLIKHRDLIRGGVALDLACGLGQNTIWLARRDCLALGVDRSLVALQLAVRDAHRQGLGREILFVQADLDRWRPAAHSVDVLCVFRFLDRRAFPAIRSAVRRGGLLFYSTRHIGVLARQPDANRAFLLERDELRQRFDDWKVVFYDEGPEDASLVVRRP